MRKFFTHKIITLILSLVFSGIFLFANNSYAKETYSGTVLPQPKAISAFELTSSNAQPFTEKNLQDHWSLLFFGFTNCPMVCPTSMATLAKVYEKVAAHQKTVPQVVFISVDPERDTPERINQYLASFNKNFQGVTGTKEQLDKLSKELGVLYMKIAQPNNKKSANDYTIDHSGSILLTDPQGRLYAIFTMPHNADAIAKDFMTITAKNS